MQNLIYYGNYTLDINKYGSSSSDSYVNYYYRFLDTSFLLGSSANLYFAFAHSFKLNLTQDISSWKIEKS